MKSLIKNLLIVLILLAIISTGCQRKSNCPTFWGQADNAQTASDGKKDSGENLASADDERSVEFPMVRVKRDKNGIVTKKTMKKGPKKHKDPRKDYKPVRK